MSDLLQEPRFIEIDDDVVRFKGFYVGEITGVRDDRPYDKPGTDSSAKKEVPPRSPSNAEAERTMPIPLGVGRLVRLQLPEDWDAAKDLPKLLKMLQLSLGNEDDIK